MKTKISPLLTPTGRQKQFSAVFKLENQEKDKWRITGSGVRGFPRDAPITDRIAGVLDDNGIPIREYSMGSPANMDSYHLEAKFLDGGLNASTGAYWGEKGAWVTGTSAVKLVAELLDLKMPEVFP
jgi:hypothetical protein